MRNTNDNQNENNIMKNIYEKIILLLHLETVTSYGKINLTFIIILTVFCVAYASSDVVRQFILAIEDTIKSAKLNEDIYHSYESTSILEIIVPIIILMVACLYFIYLQENKKYNKKVSRKKKKSWRILYREIGTRSRMPRYIKNRKYVLLYSQYVKDESEVFKIYWYRVYEKDYKK